MRWCKFCCLWPSHPYDFFQASPYFHSEHKSFIVNQSQISFYSPIMRGKLGKNSFFFHSNTFFIPLFPHLENLQESFTYKVSCLLPGDPTIYEYSKYRRLLKQQPTDKTLQHSYEVAFAKLQLAVSRRHYELKSINKDDALIRYAEELMRQWKMYFY